MKGGEAAMGYSHKAQQAFEDIAVGLELMAKGVRALGAELSKPDKPKWKPPRPEPKPKPDPKPNPSAPIIDKRDRLISIKEVKELTSLGDSFIYQKMKEGTFPKSVSLGAKTSRWRYGEIEDWINSHFEGQK